MKWVKWGLLSALVIAAVVVFSERIFLKKYTYYYYPEWNAYYDVNHKNYIYSVDGGKTWDTITNSSNTVANTLGEKVVIHTRSPEIWLENTEHRRQYGGMLNDIVGEFLKTGEDKKTIKKKNTEKDSSKTVTAITDSTVSDSIGEIENWIHETTIQANTTKEKKEVEPKQFSTEDTEKIELPVTDSTGV
jgi:hypothetical protein